MLNIVPSLPVEDVTRTVEFYRQVLGFELIGISGKGFMTRARIRMGNVELMFRSRTGEHAGATFGAYDPEDRMILHFYVSDVFALYNRIKKEVRIVRDIERTLFGHGEFAIEDPDGVILSFSQPFQTARAHATY